MTKVTLIYIWKLKLLYWRGGCCIGLDSSNKEHKNADFCNPDVNTHPFYAFHSGYKYSLNGAQRYGDYWRQTDIITLQLDKQKKTLKLFVDKQDQGIAFENIDFAENKVYNLAISRITKNQIIKLVRFEERIIS